MTALSLIGLNCKGMLKYGEWEALMREAKRERVNVLTLQELNVKPEMVNEFKRRALALDFEAFISCSDSAACRGGTGVLVRCGFAAASPEAVADSTRGDTLGGGLCAIDLMLGEDTVRLASLYVPSSSWARGMFLEKLEACHTIGPDTIVQGDMNCVATPAVDEQRRSGVQRDSDPHGLRLESVLRRKPVTF